MRKQEDFFAWQEQALGVLLAWGAGSTVFGAGLARSPSPGARMAGRQAIGWGLVDLALAANGRRSARLRRGQADHSEIDRAVERFRTILAVNAALDVAYVLTGAQLARGAGAKAERRGTGLGILAQGLFLLVYDLVLLRGAGRWIERGTTNHRGEGA
jgi:hypothetical protein